MVNIVLYFVLTKHKHMKVRNTMGPNEPKFNSGEHLWAYFVIHCHIRTTFGHRLANGDTNDDNKAK